MKTTKHNITNTAEPIKPGYKKTPVGVIPEDWEVKRIKSVADVIGGGTPSTTEVKYWNGNINWFTPSEIKGKFVSKSERKITKAGLKNSSAKELPIGTILLTTRATIGEVSLSTEISTTNQGFQSLVCKNGTNNVFLYELIKFNKNELYRRANGSTFLEISGKEVRKIPLAIPPLPEQKAIADCLSTWDKGIEKLSALIAFKKEQKKGLMQGLFSGKLKVENGELVKVEDEKLWLKGWKEVLLKTISTITKGKQLNRSELNEADKYPSYSGGITPSGYTDKYNCDANTIIISEGGNSCGYVNFIDVDFWLGGHCYSVENNAKKMNKNFLYNILKYNEPKIMRLRVGSGLPNVQKGDLEKFKLKVPSLKEQTEIAEVFNAANKEIELLEQKLESYKTQKKGLMQVLLTGEKRLVDS